MDDRDTNQTQGGQTQGQQQPQAGGIGTLVKEQEPKTSQAGVSEFVKPSGAEVEPKIHDELEKIGVRHVPEFPKVGPEEQKVGIRESTPPVKTEPSGLAQIPMTEEEAKQTLKYEKPTASIRWVAALVVKYFKQMHHKLLTRKN